MFILYVGPSLENITLLTFRIKQKLEMRQKKRQFGVRIEIDMQCYLIITQTKYYSTIYS